MFSRLKKNSKKNIFYPILIDGYKEFFEKNYLGEWQKTKCLCKKINDLDIGNFDRHGAKFETVLCRSCGLMRAKYYLTDSALNDFYKFNFRKLVKTRKPEENFDHQYKVTVKKKRYELIEKFLNMDDKIIFDVGGSSGGVIKKYIKNNTCFVFDYDKDYTDFANQMGIKSVFGGLDEAINHNLKPNLVILSHVIEHWNNFEVELLKLLKLLGENSIAYLETPGLDSLKEGRRNSDILGEIQVAHKYYFTSKVLKNILENSGFEVLFIDSHIRAIVKASKKSKGIKKNFFIDSILNIFLAEIRRFLSISKKKILKIT